MALAGGSSASASAATGGQGGGGGTASPGGSSTSTPPSFISQSVNAISSFVWDQLTDPMTYLSLFFPELGLPGKALAGIFPVAARVSGKFGESLLARMFPNALKQISKLTNLGRRVPDQVDGLITREAKAGLVHMSGKVGKQIAKDADLVRQGYTVEWHFFKSPTTGMSGPSDKVWQALQQAGINIIEH